MARAATATDDGVMPGTIVVGVDDSEGSHAALRWAIEEAGIRDATVRAVYAWQYPYVGELAGIAAAAISYEQLEDDAKQVLDRVLADVDAGDVPIDRSVGHGGAANVLLDAAKDATLLVVGSRGRGGFAGLLLGSVSQQVVHHATCPVVVVPVA